MPASDLILNWEIFEAGFSNPAVQWAIVGVVIILFVVLAALIIKKISTGRLHRLSHREMQRKEVKEERKMTLPSFILETAPMKRCTLYPSNGETEEQQQQQQQLYINPEPERILLSTFKGGPKPEVKTKVNADVHCEVQKMPPKLLCELKERCSVRNSKEEQEMIYFV